MLELKDIVLVVVSLAIGVLANFIWHLTADWFVQFLRGVLLARFTPYGLTGIWLSTYWYTSSESEDIRASKHLIVLSQVGRRVVGTSLPQPDGSHIRLSLRKGDVDYLSGTWKERTSKDVDYEGALQLAIGTTQDKLEGKWIGFDRRRTIRNERWELTRLDRKIDRKTKKSLMATYSGQVCEHAAGVYR